MTAAELAHKSIYCNNKDDTEAAQSSRSSCVQTHKCCPIEVMKCVLSSQSVSYCAPLNGLHYPAVVTNTVTSVMSAKWLCVVCVHLKESGPLWCRRDSWCIISVLLSNGPLCVHMYSQMYAHAVAHEHSKEYNCL